MWILLTGLVFDVRDEGPSRFSWSENLNVVDDYFVVSYTVVTIKLVTVWVLSTWSFWVLLTTRRGSTHEKR